MKPIVLELKLQGKTQEQIAEITKLSQPTISKILRNNISNILENNAYIMIPDCREKLPKEAYPDIYERYRKGETQNQIAAHYKITQPKSLTILSFSQAAKSREVMKQAYRGIFYCNFLYRKLTKGDYFEIIFEFHV